MLQLNPEQRQAVEHGEGPLLVVAGPGSGKTRVITERIAWLAQNVPGLRPENILALTYTEKASEEMKSRVAQKLPGIEKPPHVSTFHAFCLYVLKQHHFEQKLLDKVDVWIFLRQRMELLGLRHFQKLAAPGAFLHDLNDFFSRCQDELIEPDEFAAFVAKAVNEFRTRTQALPAAERKLESLEIEKLSELANVFRESRRMIQESGSSSFGSLISETVRLWDREPETLEKIRQRFRFFLVDEFQDTNYGQAELLRRLAAPPHNITAVGDDDQAIYRFRGAAHGAFAMFHERFPRAQTVFLNRNYRSTRRILSVADAAIAHNEREQKKPALRTENGEGARVRLLASADHESEAAGITDMIENLVRKGRQYGEIAVLYRAHSYRELLVDEFRRRQIPFAIRGLSLDSTIILRDLIAYLRLIASPHDDISLTRVLLTPRWKFPEELALEMRRQAARGRRSLFEALEVMCGALFKHEIEATGWAELRTLLADLRKAAQRVRVPLLLDKLIEGLELRLPPGAREALYVDAFRSFLEKWEAKSETGKLAEFIKYFDFFREAGGKIEAPQETARGKAVQLMTVHAAKGLEFPVVFILSVASRRFPATERKPLIEFPDALRKGPAPPRNIHLQEERRLFFVALTRAQQELYVASVGGQGKKASRLIDDLRSDPAVLARDIEAIELPTASRSSQGSTAATVPQKPRDKEQGSLFDANLQNQGVHPPLAEWAARAPDAPDQGKLSLSATAIETYLACPLKFKFDHYLKIPTGPQAALTFGSVMHQAVRKYFELRRHGTTPFETVRDFYLRAWKSAGYEDSYQEETYKKAGLEQLREFVERQNALPVDAEKIQSEQTFRLELGDVILEGRIDQIQPLDGRPTPAVELVDYKTGRPKTQRDADHSLQLSVYALAARRQMKLEPERLTFYYLTSNETVSTVRTEGDLSELQKEIEQVAASVRRLEFAPKPGYACRFCDYVPVCPAHEKDV